MGSISVPAAAGYPPSEATNTGLESPADEHETTQIPATSTPNASAATNVHGPTIPQPTRERLDQGLNARLRGNILRPFE
ncbi:hypothetical protein KV605_29505 [Rhodococcus opacus]|nr:hypothetical protein [Rhodococcus opacus]